MFTLEDYRRSAEELSARIGDRRPTVMVVLGTGLGDLAAEIQDAVVIPYGELPNFPVSTAPSHAGRFVCGTLAGVQVLAMQGRFHLYEGWTPEQAAFPVRVAHMIGVRSLLVTNAAGGIDRAFSVGDLMLITDHIKLQNFSPLTGANIDEFGPRFCDMTYAYAPAYQALARRKAAELGITLREGVYFFFAGPQFETPAEIRAARTLGGHAAGMSTVPEVIAANHCGMKVLGISLITNMAAGILPERLSDVDVAAAADRAGKNFSALVRACLPEME